MYVTCSTLCFAKHSMEEALHTIRLLQFTKADLAIHRDGPHLTPAEVVHDPARTLQRLRAANLPFAAFHLDLPADRAESTTTELRTICRLARVLAVPLITVPAAAPGCDMDAEIGRLTNWVKIAASEGLMLTVETDRTTLTSDPATAELLCQRVPGLGLTLDPSHYHVGCNGSVDYDSLFAYVRHLRLRDSGSSPDQFQVRVGQGELEYSRFITQLERFDYDRALSVDIRDIADCPFPIEPEVRKLKYLLESLI